MQSRPLVILKLKTTRPPLKLPCKQMMGRQNFKSRCRLILVKEEGQWKVDAEQTMMSMFGGAMGEMMKGLGKALEEGFKKGFEEMGKSIAGGMQKGLEVMTQTSADQ